MTKLNRLQSLKANLDHRQKQFENTDRKARTRTLIQMSGLLSMIGLPELCGINEGDNLQLDIPNQDKAATLLGMLVHLNESLFNSQNMVLNHSMLERFKQRGIQMLKDHVIKKIELSSRCCIVITCRYCSVVFKFGNLESLGVECL